MKHEDLKIGMKVKRVSNFNDLYFSSTKGNISTVKKILKDFFFTKENENEKDHLIWYAEYFEPVEEFKEETMTNKISLDKKYRTRCGYPVRVLCVDMKKNNWPVVCVVEYPDGSELDVNVTINGKEWDEEEGELDLIEVSPWEDFKKDDKVMVSNDGKNWEKRYFSHIEDGKPWCYYDGFSSWTTIGGSTFVWNYCRKPTQEELEW